MKSFADRTALAAANFAVNIRAETDFAEENSPGVLMAAVDFERVEAGQMMALTLLAAAQTVLLLSLPQPLQAAWLAWLELRYAG